MDTGNVVILGAGIMGISAAYYLSNEIEPSKIHIFDPSPNLFDCASGKAAGFLAQDWFSSDAMLKLGALSLSEHKNLAEKHNGRDLWGYTEGRAISYYESSVRAIGVGVHDWLWEGGSRSGVAPAREGEMQPHLPPWLHPGVSEDLSVPGGTAQVNPRDLCGFLLKTCQERGVQVHQPARVKSVQHEGSGLSVIKWASNVTADSNNTLTCSHILLAAGPWTPGVFDQLFSLQKQRNRIPIAPLAGWSVTVDLPLKSAVPLPTTSDAVFASGTKEGFSPEFFTRVLSLPAGSTKPDDAKWEIWLGGLNSSTEPLPDASSPVTAPATDDPHIESLMSVAKRFFVYSKDFEIGEVEDVSKSTKANETVTGPRLIETGLCFRPATKTGRPIIGRIPESMYREDISGFADTKGISDGPKGGLFICSGHGPWGITLCLGSGKVISEIMLHDDRDKAWDSLGMALDA